MLAKISNKKYIFLLIVVLLGLVIRISFLGASSLGNDEAKTALGVDFPHSFVLPTLSVLSQHIFGVSETSARLPMALFGVLAVYLMYLLGKEIHKDFSLSFALLLAILPVNVIFSRSALLDIPLSTAYIFVLLFFIKYEKAQNTNNIFLLFLGLLLLPFLKIQAVYFLASLFIYLLVITKGFFWKDKRFFLLVLGFVPFFFYILSQPQQLYDLRSVVIGQTGKTDILKFLGLLWDSWGILFLFSLFGFVSLLFKKRELNINKRESRINILMIIVFAVVLASLFSSPKNHYMTTLDVPVIFLGVFFIFNIIKVKNFKILAFLLIIINFFYLIFLTDNFSPYKDPSRSFWKKNYSEINNDIVNFSEDPIVFLDTNLSFTAKWYIRYETKKLEQYISSPIIAKDKNTVIVLQKETLNAKKRLFSGFNIKEYSDIYLLTKKANGIQ